MAALKRELAALLPILTDPENEDRTPEEIAESLIQALDDVRAKSPRMAVVIRHRWGATDKYSLAVLGPFGIRAETQAKGVGEAACSSLAHPGDGRFVFAPVFPSPSAAWEALKPPPAAEFMRAQVARDVAAWRPGLWTEDSQPCPTCRCGLVGAEPCRVNHPEVA